MGRKKHPEPLTPAEQRVLEEVRTGATNAEIAMRLGLSINTVKYHVANMLSKLEAEDRKELAAWPGAGGRSWRRFGLWIGAGMLGVGAVVGAAVFFATRDSSAPEQQAFVAALLNNAEGQATTLVVREWPNDSTVTLIDGAQRTAIGPAWSPDGQYLAWLELDTNSYESKGVIWQRTSRKRVEFPLALETFIAFAWSPDSKLLASLGEQFELWRPDGTAVFAGEREDPGSRRVGSRTRSAWSPDGNLLAFALNDRLTVYDRSANAERSFTSEELSLPLSLKFVGIYGWLNNHELGAIDARGMQAWNIDAVAGSASENSDFRAVEDVLDVEFPVEMYEQFPGASRTRVDFTADARGYFGAWVDRSDLSDTGLVIRSGDRDIPIDLRSIDQSLQNVDVVLVGDWPEP
ncbi:MAG: LuxR C-terminal-related transcriptional regulator [Dehalococcoidia bacterium]